MKYFINIYFTITILIISLSIISLTSLTDKVLSQTGHVARNYKSSAGETKPYKLLKEMTQYISRHDNYTFKAEVMYDRVIDPGVKIQVSGSEKVFVQKPDKIFIEFKTDYFSDRFLYSSKSATYLDTTTGLYTFVNELPSSINNTLDYLDKSFGFEMPLSDLIYIYPYKRIVGNINSSQYIGTSYVFGVRCHHLLFEENDKYWQIWIEDGNRTIPRKLVVTYKNQPESPQFIAVINDWIFNEPLPAKLFNQNLRNNARPSPENLFIERGKSEIGIFD